MKNHIFKNETNEPQTMTAFYGGRYEITKDGHEFFGRLEQTSAYPLNTLPDWRGLNAVGPESETL